MKPLDQNKTTKTQEQRFRIGQWPATGADDFEKRSARRALIVGRVVVIALTITMLGLLGRVAQLQAKPDAPIAELRDTQTGKATLAAMRGAITDRRGRVIAATRVAHRMYCDPQFIEDRSTFCETIAFEIGLNPIDLEMKLSGRSRSRYVLLNERLTDEQVERFHEAEIPGIYLEPVIVRDYPQGGLAGTLIGFTGRDGDGLDGLEYHWEDRLAASPGQYAYLRDNRRRAIWVDGESYVPYEDGENIRLTIDAVIQGIAERELAKAVEQFNADSGQIIVIQPHTGEILAIATYPSYDPRDFGSADQNQRRNRPVTDMFEPGSIFKPFVWAGLTEMGAARPEELVDCTTSGAWRMPNGRILHDVHGKGLISWLKVLAFSSNIGMARMAQRVEVSEIYDIMQSFGFGRPTGIDLPGELGGMLIMHEDRGAQSYSHGSWPMGQEVGVTGLQMVRAMSVLANGGVMIEPRIEMRIPGEDSIPLPLQSVVSVNTARAAVDAMRFAVLEGTGQKADSPYYDLFGKTGTAQLPNDTGGYHADRYFSSFLGGAPADSPRLVVGCFIRDPDRTIGHYGGIVAAPAVRTVLEQSLIYLGVPTNPGTDPAELMIEVIEIE